MSAALSATSYIYQGVWVNWSNNKGPVLGSTLTVGPVLASILSPALAIVISIAGSQLWTLIQFALHQLRATSSPRNFVFHQQQVVLRNTSTDLNTIWRLVRIAIAWRHQKDTRVVRDSLLLIFWSVLHFTAVVLLGLFSSSLLEANDQVLSRSPWCGAFNTSYIAELYSSNPTPENNRLAMEYSNYHNTRYASVQQHVDICSSDVDGCDTLPHGRLDWTSKIVPGACPFGNDICHPDIDGSISFDTGYLSSSSHLGFNANPKDRVAFRLVAQCAPLNDQDHATGWQDVPASANLPARQVADALYGPNRMSSRNATFSHTKQNMDCDQRMNTPAYSLDSAFVAPNGSIANGTATFDPIAGLQSADSDTSLITMYFNNMYDGPVSDPWFSAKVATNETDAFCAGVNQTLFTRDIPLTSMACTQKWQICKLDSSSTPKNDQCTLLQGLSQVQTAIAANTFTDPFTPRQLVTANRIINSAIGSSFFYVIDALSKSTSPPLKARNLISDTVGQQLPNNQWQNETEYWMDILLAYLQQTSLDYSTGQFAASTSYINVTTKPSLSSTSPSSDVEEVASFWLCQNQIIKSQTYRNFNFFALMLTVVLCAIVIIVGLSIEDLISYVRQRNLRYSGANGKQDMWVANSDIEMLKTIDEVKNESTWGISRNGIPLAPPGHKVSIDALRADSHEVRKGTGVILKAVKRQRTGLSTASQGIYKDFDGHVGHKRCATCSTFELSPVSGDESPQKTQAATMPTAQTNDDSALAFHNAFKRGFERDFHPKLTVAEVDTPMTVSSEVLPHMPSQYIHARSTHRPQSSHSSSPLPTPLVGPTQEQVLDYFQNDIPRDNENLLKPQIVVTPVSPPLSHSEYSVSISDIEHEQAAQNSTSRQIYHFSTLSRQASHRKERGSHAHILNKSKVYRSPSPSPSSSSIPNVPPTALDTHGTRPPIGWGVLPRRVSRLWDMNLSWNGRGRDSGRSDEGYVR